MFRHPACRLALLALTFLSAWPATARASGAWTTYLRMRTCTDMIAMRDTVWMATGEAGLLRYLRSTDTFESIVREPGSVASNALTSLAFDRSGRLWAGTSGKGVSRLSTDGLAWDLVNAFDGIPGDTVTTLRADGDTLWIGTTRGIALWNGRVVAGAVPDIGTPSPFRSNFVTGIVVFGDSLFVSTTDGVYIGRLSQSLRRESWASADAGIGDKNIVEMATTGSELFALSANLVYRLNPAAGTWGVVTTASPVKRLSDDFGAVMCASVDSLSYWTGAGWKALVGAPVADATSGGDIEFATAPDGVHFATRAGLLRREGSTSWASLTPPGPVGNNITNLVADGTQTWVATTDQGISRWTASGWTNYPAGCCGPTQFTSFAETRYTYALQIDRTGYLWASHWDTGVDRVNLRTDPLQFAHPFSCFGVPKEDTLSRHSDGWSSAVDSMGYVYFGGDSPCIDCGATFEPVGVDVYDSTGTRVITWKATPANGMGTNQVRAIAYDRVSRMIWLGLASKGVVYIRLDSLDADRQAAGNDHGRLPPAFSAVSELLRKNVYGLVVHGDSVWVLSTSDLKRVRSSDRLVRATLEIIAQPPKGAVHPLDVASDGTVWAASVEGVRRFFPGGGREDFTVDNSPLADNEVRSVSVEPRTGVVWLGTANGVSRFDPFWKAPPAPRLPSLTIQAYPNPSYLNGLGISLRLSGNATAYEGEILDITGRVVTKFTTSGNGRLAWDGRDRDGVLVRSGVYFVHARSGGHEATARVVVLR